MKYWSDKPQQRIRCASRSSMSRCRASYRLHTSCLLPRKEVGFHKCRDFRAYWLKPSNIALTRTWGHVPFPKQVHLVRLFPLILIKTFIKCPLFQWNLFASSILCGDNDEGSQFPRRFSLFLARKFFFADGKRFPVVQLMKIGRVESLHFRLFDRLLAITGPAQASTERRRKLVISAWKGTTLQRDDVRL